MVNIFYDNFLNTDQRTSATPSSENSTYPETNTVDYNHRTKVFRTADITSGTVTIVSNVNNSFRFSEGGPSYYATCAAGTYTESEFATAAALALTNHSSASGVYSGSYNSTTKKITLTQDSGASTFNMYCADGTSIPFYTLLGFDTTATKTGSLSYTGDTEVLSTKSMNIVYNLGSAKNPSGCFLIGDRNDGLQIPSTATIKIQGHASEVWTSPSVDLTMNYNEKIIHYIDTAGFGSYQYWRLYISWTSNPDAYIQIGNVFLGDSIGSFSRGSVQFPLDVQFQDTSVITRSENGQSFLRKKYKFELISFNYDALNYQDKEIIENFWNEIGLYYPFYVDLDPDKVFSSDRAKYIRYVRFESEPSYSLDSPNYFSSDFQLREQL